MPLATPITLTVEQIRHMFDYNCLTGDFVRRKDGKLITWKVLKVNDKGHELARYIWPHFHGFHVPLDRLVEHEDRDHFNNKITNLRLATYNQNGFNLVYPNQHGYKGITYQLDRPIKPWLAQIRLHGVKTNLGRYETKEEAAEAYRQAAIAHHGEFLCL